jgi:hypothetical protein
MKFPPIRIAIEQDPRCILLEPVEWLRLTVSFDKKTHVVTITAWPELCRKPHGLGTSWMDRHFPLQWTITSSPTPITQARARELYYEARDAVAARFGDAWDFAQEACRRWGWVIVPEYQITDEEFALLDEIDPEDL